MSRTIRPVGPVSPALRKAGYSQYAVIFVDGKQVPDVAILSMRVNDKIKYVGHWIDSSGEIHKTNPMVDVKRAAKRIMTIVGNAPAPAEPVAKAPAKRSAPKPKPAARQRMNEAQSVLIDCKGCGFLHRDDVMCP